MRNDGAKHPGGPTHQIAAGDVLRVMALTSINEERYSPLMLMPPVDSIVAPANTVMVLMVLGLGPIKRMEGDALARSAMYTLGSLGYVPQPVLVAVAKRTLQLEQTLQEANVPLPEGPTITDLIALNPSLYSAALPEQPEGGK